MTTRSGSHSWREAILTVATGIAVGSVAAALLLITGRASETVWSAVVAAGYLAIMMILRAADQRRGRPAPGVGQIVAGTIATGLGTLALMRIWQYLVNV